MKKTLSLLLVAAMAALCSTSASAQDNTTKNLPEEFKPSGSFSMQFFADYYYMLSADTMPSIAGKSYYEPNNHVSTGSYNNTRYFQAFDIRRVYLGYDYHFTPKIAGQLLLSHENGYNNGDIVLDGNRGLYLKAANIRFQDAVPMSTLIIGQQGTPTFAIDEAAWGYRSIEKTVMDFRGMAQSNDLGIQLTGNFDAGKMFGYSAMISNGNAAAEENDKYKKFTGDLNAKFLDGKIVVDLAGDYMDLPNNPKVKVGVDSALNVSRSNTTFKAFGGYVTDPITVGVVYAMQAQKGQSQVTAGGDAAVSALSVFAHAAIMPKQLYVFARYDMFDPDTKATGSNVSPSQTAAWKENFITAGLDWLPDSKANVHVEPNVYINTFKDKSSTALDREAIMLARLTFFYKF